MIWTKGEKCIANIEQNNDLPFSKNGIRIIFRSLIIMCIVLWNESNKLNKPNGKLNGFFTILHSAQSHKCFVLCMRMEINFFRFTMKLLMFSFPLRQNRQKNFFPVWLELVNKRNRFSIALSMRRIHNAMYFNWNGTSVTPFKAFHFASFELRQNKEIHNANGKREKKFIINTVEWLPDKY